MKKLLLLAFVLCSSLLCRAQEERVILGDEQTSEYFPILKDKRIAIFSNHTGMIGDKHLLDILLENKFNVVAIFSPEHGFRGDADAGEHVSSSVDKKTGVPILRQTFCAAVSSASYQASGTSSSPRPRPVSRARSAARSSALSHTHSGAMGCAPRWRRESTSAWAPTPPVRLPHSTTCGVRSGISGR